MNKITTGVITGAIAGAVGLYAMSDKRMRNKLVKDSKKMLNKTGDLIDKINIF